MKRAVIVMLVLCMVTVGLPVTALADDASLIGGTGGTAYAIYDTPVEMEEEIIDITVKDGCSYVSCQFFFHNTGDSTELLVGFPAGDPNAIFEPTGQTIEELESNETGEGGHDEFATGLNWFRTFINGKRTHVSIKSGLKPEGNNKDALYYPKWYTWNMAFKKDERIKAVNKYWMVNTRGLGHDWEEAKYILMSGSTWKGPIGKVTVRMKFEGYDITGLEFIEMQPSYIEEDGTIVWKAENIEPQEDIRVYYETNSLEGEELDNPFNYTDAKFDEYGAMQERMIRNFDAGHYNGTIWWGNKLFKKFGAVQSNQYYYAMGVSYYMLHKYDKALDMLQRVENKQVWNNSTLNGFYNLSLYYEAAIYKKTGNDVKYKECLGTLVKESYPWLQLWAQSRLSDLGVSG